MKQSNSFYKKYHRSLICIFISLYGLYLRYLRYADVPFWNDETYQLSYSVGSLKEFWKWNFYGDMTCFPGDYLLTYPFVQIFLNNIWGLRAPHVVATILGFYLLYCVGNRFFNSIYGYFIAFMIFCFNATLGFHAFEFRPYAVIPTLALGSLYCFDTFVENGQSWGFFKYFFSVVFLIFLSLFHAYGFIIICITFGYVMMKNFNIITLKKFLWKNLKLLGPIFAVTFMIWVWYVIGSQTKSYRNPFEYIPNPSLDISGFLKGVFGNLMGNKYLYFLFGSFASIFFMPLKKMLEHAKFFLSLVILPVAIILLLDIKASYWFLQRQFIWVMPFFAIFIGMQGEYLILRLIQIIKRIKQ